jgi:hypothetical protein
MDIVQLIFAHQMVLVKRLDEGKISIEEAKLSIAELNTRITTEVQKRDMQAWALLRVGGGLPLHLKQRFEGAIDPGKSQV